MIEKTKTARPRRKAQAKKAAPGRAAKLPEVEAQPVNGHEASQAEAAKPKRRSRRKVKAGAIEEEPAWEQAQPAEEMESPDPSLRKQLMKELDALIKRLRSIHPGYNPPPFSARRLLDLVEEGVGGMSPEMQMGILEKLRKTIGEDLFDADTWKGLWYMLNYSLEYQTDVIKRRVTGEYETDA